MNNDEQCCYSTAIVLYGASCPLERVKWGEGKKKEKERKNAALDSAENAESKRHHCPVVVGWCLVSDWCGWIGPTCPSISTLTHSGLGLLASLLLFIFYFLFLFMGTSLLFDCFILIRLHIHTYFILLSNILEFI